jgi:hypothetical protein
MCLDGAGRRRAHDLGMRGCSSVARTRVRGHVRACGARCVLWLPPGAPCLLPQGGSHTVDAVLTFGGDGTVLHGASLFQGRCPPFLSFAFGTVGFLAPFRNVRMPEVVVQVCVRVCACVCACVRVPLLAHPPQPVPPCPPPPFPSCLDGTLRFVCACARALQPRQCCVRSVRPCLPQYSPTSANRVWGGGMSGRFPTVCACGRGSPVVLRAPQVLQHGGALGERTRLQCVVRDTAGAVKRRRFRSMAARTARCRPPRTWFLLGVDKCAGWCAGTCL